MFKYAKLLVLAGLLGSVAFGLTACCKEKKECSMREKRHNKRHAGKHHGRKHGMKKNHERRNENRDMLYRNEK